MYVMYVILPLYLYVFVLSMYVCNTGAVALTLEQNEHEDREKDLKLDKRSLKTELREMELAHEAAIKKLKLVRACSVWNALKHYIQGPKVLDMSQ